MNVVKLFVVVMTCLTLSGCPIGPYSRLYKPISEWEESAFKKADREIFPNDVREGFASHDSSRVAWPGIIVGASPKKTDSTLEVRFVIEHHYYDWIEDFSIQQERIFLSPRGEGVFETTWNLKPDSDTVEVAESIGKMIIVYGIPSAINDSVIQLSAYYVRVIDRQWFATDIMDYGRPGEPVNLLRIP